MAVGGALQSGFPTQGLRREDVEVIGSADHDEIAALPNEEAAVVVVDEDGQQLSPSRVPEMLELGSHAGTSQDTLTGPAESIKAVSSKGKDENASLPATDLEKQSRMLPSGLEAKLDFSTVDLVTRQALLLKCTKALLAFGAPSHRIEADLDFAAEILAVPAQFVHNPNCVGASKTIDVAIHH